MKKVFYLFLISLLCISCRVNITADSNSSGKTKVNRYTVKYESQYGTCPASITVDEGTVLKAEQLAELSQYGQIFRGWFIDDAKIEPDSYTVKKNVTLKAAWDYGYVISVAEFYDLAPELKSFRESFDKGEDVIVYIYITDEDPDKKVMREALVRASSKNGAYSSYIYLDLSKCMKMESVVYGDFSGRLSNKSSMMEDYDSLDESSKAGYIDAEDYYFFKRVCSIDFTCLVSLILPESIIEIGDYAFAATAGLKELYLPSSIKEFGEEVFTECYCSAKIVLPDSMEEIPKGTFAFFGLPYGTAEIIWPKNIKSIGPYAFAQCIVHNVSNQFEIPEGITTIKNNAFKYNYCETFIFPTTLEEIDAYAFAHNRKVKELNFPSSIKYVGEKAFSYCPELKKVTFASGTDSFVLDTGVFADCEKLECIDLSQIVDDENQWEIEITLPLGSRIIFNNNSSIKANNYNLIQSIDEIMSNYLGSGNATDLILKASNITFTKL